MLCSPVVKISDSHPDDPGSNPGVTKEREFCASTKLKLVSKVPSIRTVLLNAV